MKRGKGLHFTDIGAGKITLVFLHYFGGSSNTWYKVIAGLSNEFRCVAIDLPGFGASQERHEKLSVSKCAGEAAQVINLLELKQYVLIGHSMGGKIAACIASTQPAGLISLLLVAPSPPVPEPMQYGERTRLLQAYGDEAALKKILDDTTAHPLTGADTETVIRDNQKASKTAWEWWIESGSREDISSNMQAVYLHVLIISGAEDSKLSKSYLQKEMLPYFPLAVFEDVPDTGHLIPMEAPVLLANTIKKFIKKFKSTIPG